MNTTTTISITIGDVGPRRIVLQRGTGLHVTSIRTLEYGRPITHAEESVLARNFGVQPDEFTR